MTPNPPSNFSTVTHLKNKVMNTLPTYDKLLNIIQNQSSIILKLGTKY